MSYDLDQPQAYPLKSCLIMQPIKNKSVCGAKSEKVTCLYMPHKLKLKSITNRPSDGPNRIRCGDAGGKLLTQTIN